jgi:hypothetical protein
MKKALCLVLLLVIAALAPVACTNKPVEKPADKVAPPPQLPPKDKVDPNTPKVG